MTAMVLLATGFGPLAVAAILAATRPVVRPVVAGTSERVSSVLGWWETRQFERDADARFLNTLTRYNAERARERDTKQHVAALKAMAVCQ